MKKEEKSKIIGKYKRNTEDTGSSEVQIAVLTERINQMVGHLKTHKKDQSSRRGLLVLVGRRKRLLKYLERSDAKRYEALTESLNLR
jgi:small subunit ribosomal protein S15